MAKVVAVFTNDESAEIAHYFDVGDAAGDIDGGDFWTMLRENHHGKVLKEIKIIPDKVVEIEPLS